MSSSSVVVVVPCYNEADRLDTAAFAGFASDRRWELLFVNDGSTDDTARVLEEIRKSTPRVQVLNLPANGGKGEAVRLGLLKALAGSPDVVGFIDADLSTPLTSLDALLLPIEHGSARVVFGSRVAMLGHDIVRKRTRHYLGRLFATLASLVLRLPVYDTQCGAKFFRRTAALEAALATPFHSSWAFDVELLGRLLIGAPGVTPLDPADCLEVPLERWEDVGGSRLRPLGMARAAFDLAVIDRALRERRRALAAGSG